MTAENEVVKIVVGAAAAATVAVCGLVEMAQLKTTSPEKPDSTSFPMPAETLDGPIYSAKEQKYAATDDDLNRDIDHSAEW
jgi:hypothetical protein